MERLGVLLGWSQGKEQYPGGGDGFRKKELSHRIVMETDVSEKELGIITFAITKLRKGLISPVSCLTDHTLPQLALVSW